jgi:acetate kinase
MPLRSPRGSARGRRFVRGELCARLRFLGVDLDSKKNEDAEPDCDIATKSSAVRILVVRAREELIAARAARELLDSDGDPG